MRHFIFTILLVVPLLLTAQSKKEQIATLNLRVDSLFEVLINERVNNEQTLSDKSDKIFQLSQEKSALEKNIVQLSQEKGGLEKEIAEKKVFFGELKQELRLALNELDVLNTELDNGVQNVIEMVLKYVSLDADIDEDGWETCVIRFNDTAEGSWNEPFSFNCVNWYFWGLDDHSDHPSLIEGEFYVVSVCLVHDDANYTDFGVCNVQVATPEEIESASNW